MGCTLAAADFVEVVKHEILSAYLVAVDLGAIRAKKLFPAEVLTIKSLSAEVMCCEPVQLQRKPVQEVVVAMTPKHFDSDGEAIVALQIVRQSNASGKDWWHVISQPVMVVVLAHMSEREQLLRASFLGL